METVERRSGSRPSKPHRDPLDDPHSRRRRRLPSIDREEQPYPAPLQSEPQPVYRRFAGRNQGDIVGRLRRAREELSEIFQAVSGDFDDNQSLIRTNRILEQINRDNSQDEAQAVPEEDINISRRRRRERLERLASRLHASLYAGNSNSNNERDTAASCGWTWMIL